MIELSCSIPLSVSRSSFANIGCLACNTTCETYIDDSPSPCPLNFYRNSKNPSLISSSTFGSSSFSLHTNSGSAYCYYVGMAAGGISRFIPPTPDAWEGDKNRAFPCRLLTGVGKFECRELFYLITAPAPPPMLKLLYICGTMPILGDRDLKF